jgi:hypothetical protein
VAFRSGSAEVLVVGPLGSGGSGELVRAFEEVGLAVVVREVPPRRGLEDLAWLALVAIPLKPFYEELAKNATADGYRRLKSVVTVVFRRARGEESSRKGAPDPRVLVFQDTATGVQVVIEPNLPDESYQQLLALDLSVFRHGPVHYDRHQRRWRSELDEAGGPTAD